MNDTGTYFTANAGQIYPPGGSLEPADVDAGGNIGVVASIERELREETGIQVPDATLIDLRHRERFPIVPAWRARYAPEVHENLEHWFALVLPFRRQISLNVQEHRQHGWLTARSATFLASSWTNRQAIRLLATRLT